MMELSRDALQTLWADGEFVLSRGRRDGDQSPLLVLAPAGDQPAPVSLQRLAHAYALRDALDPAWAARPLALVRHQGRPILLLDDPSGEVLAQLVGQPWEVTPFLRVAIGLVVALGRLHTRGLIHKDVKPANILVHAATGDVRLTGFGIASRLPRERQAPAPPEVIAGTLAYMAPEQTGRMNRSIDARSDLYSLGVTLYEMLTGVLPFIAADPLEWVHCHIARQPLPPDERVPDILGPLSAIILKLLAKTPEARYQTAAGLEADLRSCLAQWESDRRIDPFPLGAHDLSDRLLIPEKLYGREREIDVLLAAFDRVATGGTPELVLVSGYAGVGKSSVVNELHKALVPPRGLFASGKVDQYKRDIPYSTLAQAFQNLVRQILSKSETEVSDWRDALREAVGPNGQLIVNLIPEIELIIGKQPPVTDLQPQDAQYRFQRVFRRFLSVFARPEHPLALFLDDLQWLDTATLGLFEHLSTEPEVRHLLLVGAYRDNEVSPSHPLRRTLEAIRTAAATVHEIVLAPLRLDDVGRLVADALHCQRERAQPLAQLVQEKTAGNPFFAIQFVTALTEEGLLAFDPGAASWTWDLARIQAKGYTDNVVDLMVGKLNRLPPTTQEALKGLACLGNRADTATLALVHGLSKDEIHAALWEAVRAGLVLRVDGTYTFLHDRVREAAYSLIAEGERAEVHLRIGRLLAAQIPLPRREEAIFEIVNQLNRGAALIESPAEREELAELNLVAGKRAKAATAYASALNYLAAGEALLAEDRWEKRAALSFALAFHRAECEYLTGDLTAADERLSLLSRRAGNLVDSGSVVCVRVNLFTTMDRSDRAIEVCLEYLQRVGERRSPHPTKEEVRQEYDRIWRQIGSRSIEELVDLPSMNDPTTRATLDVLTAVLPPAMFTDENLFSLAICRMANLSLEHGNSDASCYAYVLLGMILGPHFGDYQSGFRFGKLGVDLVEKCRLDRFKARVYLSFGSVVTPWTRHIGTSRALVRRAFDTAQETGDLTHAAYSRHNLISHLLASGDPLGEIQRQAENGLEFARKAQFGLVVDTITGQLRLIRTLRGLTPDFSSFRDEEFDEGRFEQHLEADPGLAFATCWYWIRKLQARFYAKDYAAAIAAASKAQRLLWTSLAFFEGAEYHFYGALAQAAQYNAASAGERSQHLEALAGHHAQLALWAENCPENFADRAALVGAEIAGLEGREQDAERLYEQAIQLARKHGFVQNEGLAHELAARFYAARGAGTTAHAYLRTARYCYLRWGADGKVRQLDQSHPHLREEPPMPSPRSTIGVPVEHLDLATVVRVSQAVSGEIVLEKLIDTLMVTALEHAGAERGLLILPRGDELRIEAEATTDRGTVTVRLLGTPATPAELPDAVLQYVLRTRDSVILDDASIEHLFSTDEYIRQKHARSVLCLPLVKQSTLIGVLYLENHLTSRVFTPARIAVLQLLASQAAISLENAGLYSDLQQAEAELRQLVDCVPQHVVVIAPDGRFLHANRVALDYTGLTLDDYQAEDLIERVVHADDLERTLSEYRGGISRGAPFDIEARLLGSDAQYRWFLCRYNPLWNEQGQLSRWFATATEIEVRKQAEARVLEENLALREDIDKASMFEGTVGVSPALHAALARVSKVAPTDATVLITGETGTGKELIARAIHKRSPRSARAFVSVNCAAVPPALIASELFGHEKGAFTGATQRRLGRFELAEGGTIFLDEIGELPAETQIALLRVLQEREFERVGGTTVMRADVRVIAATNRDLEAAIVAGTFRDDLFYRLNVFPLEMPPLRERTEDIPLLVAYFVDRYARKAGKKLRGIHKTTLELLESYPWPGNIRELQNVVERSVIVCDTETFTVDASWLTRASHQPPPASRSLSRRPVAQEKELIEAALADTRGRVSGPSGAAAKLGIPPSTLDSKIRALKINKHRFKTDSL